jgi:outer membrane protein insertion porin family
MSAEQILSRRPERVVSRKATAEFAEEEEGRRGDCGEKHRRTGLSASLSVSALRPSALLCASAVASKEISLSQRGRLIAVALLVVLLLSSCGEPVRITGNHASSKRELLAVARRPVTAWQEEGHRPADLADAAEAMRSYLSDLGFANAQVDFSTSEGKRGLEARFTVREGRRVKLGRIVFPGLVHFDRRVLAALEEGMRPWFVGDLVDSAAAYIEREYRRAGFIAAKASKPRLIWSPDRRRVDVIFPISEGPRFHVARETLDFVNEPPAGARQALAALLDPPGTVYDLRLGARTAIKLRLWLQARGYLDAQVSVIDQLDVDTGTAAPIFQVTPGALHVLGALSVSGARRTAQSFIRGRLSALQAGKPIDQSVIDAAISRFYTTGLFTGVTVAKTNHPAPAGAPLTTDLNVQLSEAKNQRLDLSLGYGSYEQVRGGIEYIDEHFAGQGLRIHGGVNGSLKGWGSDLGIADPFRFGPGRTLGVETSYREREEPSFSHREFTGSLDLVDRFRLAFDNARWEFRSQYEYKLAEDFAVEGALPTAEVTGFYRSSTLRGRIRRDDRGPRLTNPQRGMLAQLSAGWNAAVLGSDIPYVELGGDWSGYLRLLRGLTGSLHVGYAQKDPNGEASLPIGERLFLGGEDTVRSFTQDQLGPANADGSPVGGLSSGVANVELRWHPWRAWPNLEFAGFYDIGAIGQKPWDFDGPYGQGVGGGIRYLTPVGPIRLDAAYNPGERFAANDPYAIHFAVGFAF